MSKIYGGSRCGHRRPRLMASVVREDVEERGEYRGEARLLLQAERAAVIVEALEIISVLELPPLGTRPRSYL